MHFVPFFLHRGMCIMFNLQCNGDPHLSFFCGVMFSDTYPRCFAALLANASARFIL